MNHKNKEITKLVFGKLRKVNYIFAVRKKFLSIINLSNEFYHLSIDLEKLISAKKNYLDL
jgi:hypothetical protein